MALLVSPKPQPSRPLLNWVDQQAGARADLGGRLVLLVDWESTKRLSTAEPRYNVFIFGRQLKKRQHTIAEAQVVAERVARVWLTQAMNLLNGVTLEKENAA